MRAVIMDSKGAVHVESRPDPVLPGPRGAIVEVDATGICGSDWNATLGRGVDAVGSDASLDSAIGAVRVGGTRVGGGHPRHAPVSTADTPGHVQIHHVADVDGRGAGRLA